MFYILFLLLATSTISSKATGAFWLSLVFIGIFSWLKNSQNEFTAPKSPALESLNIIAKGWFYFCLLALIFKTIPMIYWSGPWEERHAEFRLLIGAASSYLILHFHRLPKYWAFGVGHALSIACVLAFILAGIVGSGSAPTNRIPWAAGVSLLACLLLTWSFLYPSIVTIAGVWRICSLSAVFAVLISGVRGSYLLALIWPTLFWWQVRQSTPTPHKAKLLTTFLGLLIAVLVIFFAPRSESPLQRIQKVTVELGIAAGSADFIPNSSNGARIVLWKAGIQSLKHHWSWGLGFIGSKDLIKSAADDSHTDDIKSLGHFHNDYLHTFVEFGVLGLLSFLCYSFGMFWCAAHLYKKGFMNSAGGMLAILCMHMTTAFTNMNFAHNYYPTILSICISLILLSPQFQSKYNHQSP